MGARLEVIFLEEVTAYYFGEAVRLRRERLPLTIPGPFVYQLSVSEDSAVCIERKDKSGVRVMGYMQEHRRRLAAVLSGGK